MNSMDDGSSLGHYTNYVNGVASITFTLSRSLVIGGSGVLWVAFHDGSPDPYGHMALQPYGVADWFNHFVHIVPLFFYRFIWSRSHDVAYSCGLWNTISDGISFGFVVSVTHGVAILIISKVEEFMDWWY